MYLLAKVLCYYSPQLTEYCKVVEPFFHTFAEQQLLGLVVQALHLLVDAKIRQVI